MIKMEYGYRKEVEMDFPAAVARTKEELKKEGFGILTEIDVKATMKEKLGIDFDEYMILGACNPPFAHKALSLEKEVGLLMPCNVIVYRDGGRVFVSSILPTSAMGMIENGNLRTIAAEVEEKLKKAVDMI